MKTIFEALKNGDGKERLAIIADITSLVGVSVASVAGGLLAIGTQTTNLNVIDIFGVTISSLIGLVFLCLFLMTFIWILSKLSGPWSTPPGVKFLAKCVIWILFILTILFGVAFFYSFVTTVRFG